MQALLAFALALSSNAPGVTYKCRDVDGNWTARACLVAAPLPETNYIRQQRLRQAVARQRQEVRDRLAMYCFRLDPKASFYDCVDHQMLAYDVINQLAKKLGPVSPDSAKLARCMATNLDNRSQATDYRRTMECYFAR
ncbi:hypothetical protein [Tahibacter caeni]|uniref:hypothetical protein n=1 Tax=Tahibacter caeni TaxID=1453545 RepID=UPI0021489416|nr:hypothetical protein [Tahibacter caeni]